MARWTSPGGKGLRPGPPESPRGCSEEHGRHGTAARDQLLSKTEHGKGKMERSSREEAGWEALARKPS